MAAATRHKAAATRHKKANSRTRSASVRRVSALDAVALLKADHRQVEKWFEQYKSTRSSDRKKNLAANICQALKAHTAIEEEIFYPAFLAATKDQDLHHEAIVEHDGAKKLIAEIEASDPGDEYFDAKISVLSEMIKHHVKEEEQPSGMFSEAKKSTMDLKQLGHEMAARKQEFEARSAAA